MSTENHINVGGVNGLGEGLINTNSNDFKALKALIKENSTNQSEEERIGNEFLAIRFQMEAYLTEPQEQLIPMGHFIEQFLNVIHIKKKDFAKYIDFEESNFSALLKGRRKINPDLALKLGEIFNIHPEIWLHIETKNELIKEIQQNQISYQKYKLSDLLRKTG